MCVMSSIHNALNSDITVAVQAGWFIISISRPSYEILNWHKIGPLYQVAFWILKSLAGDPNDLILSYRIWFPSAVRKRGELINRTTMECFKSYQICHFSTSVLGFKTVSVRAAYNFKYYRTVHTDARSIYWCLLSHWAHHEEIVTMALHGASSLPINTVLKQTNVAYISGMSSPLSFIEVRW